MFVINRILCKIVLNFKVLIIMYDFVKILYRVFISVWVNKGYKNKNMKNICVVLLEMSYEL